MHIIPSNKSNDLTLNLKLTNKGNLPQSTIDDIKDNNNNTKTNIAIYSNVKAHLDDECRNRLHIPSYMTQTNTRTSCSTTLDFDPNNLDSLSITISKHQKDEPKNLKIFQKGVIKNAMPKKKINDPSLSSFISSSPSSSSSSSSSSSNSEKSTKNLLSHVKNLSKIKTTEPFRSKTKQLPAMRRSSLQQVQTHNPQEQKKVVHRRSLPPRRNTQESIATTIPFFALRHSQIFPLTDDEINHSLQHHQNHDTDELLSAVTSNVSSSMVSTTTTNTTNSEERYPLSTDPEDRYQQNPSHSHDSPSGGKIDNRNSKMRMLGKKVSQGHVNFQIVYDMLLGIRVALNSLSPNSSSVLSSRKYKKFIFDSNYEIIEPIQDNYTYSFKFKDYYPTIFQKLRNENFQLNDADYLDSLTSKYILNEFNSPGKSGSFFYFSRDYKYIIKTIHHDEHIHLRNTLLRYYNHLKSNPNTLICQFYGLYRIKFPKRFFRKRKIYFLVMNNVFPPDLAMNVTFDLKGSTWGRFSQTPLQSMPQNDIESSNNDNDDDDNNKMISIVLKDLNWLKNQNRLDFGSHEKNEAILKQLKTDVELLIDMNTMDYSLLIGIHFLESDRTDDKEEDTNDGGNRATFKYNVGDHEKRKCVICYIGIIDCLTNYSMVKKLETIWRSLNHDYKTVSAVPPRFYGNRFYKYVEESIGHIDV
ncbi:uncharacterized protein NDAI_0E03450 [Naumovozyma dairenensis CBS 421]|uniref:PIPK domain-containing protein n=1 Tax=Naumovozyma dairenensis (strain ATCC 10597 / BCRC 20456 / CBS 421 / NBRC 0211 / NRRL Y-12639) TaxID=1071378 RepID=G0WBP2_NAUDC|nr:hypothetical protein NDAI_0E03450 [Naumovozyma dairenensis CBS 421]CCD25162.1 hypothetical protein NDAI_0E03450 [Naumovozyma dairenensis CBS 421]